MSLDVCLYIKDGLGDRFGIFDGNITHNLTEMAEEAGLYKCLWHPEGLNIKQAKDLIDPLQKGLMKLITNPTFFKNFNPENGWGDYENLKEFCANYLDKCTRFPDAFIETDT